MENLTIIMQDESDGDTESLDGNRLENVLVALKVRRLMCQEEGRDEEDAIAIAINV